MLHFFRNLKTLFILRSDGYSLNKGFSLVELMVTISIVTVLFTIIILNQSTYTERAALQNLADDIGLEIAVAQSYSVSVREFTPGSGDFNTNYGVSFSLRAGSNGSPTSYIIFADLDNSGHYSGDFSSCAGECLRKVDLLRGNMISNICQIGGSSSILEYCAPTRRIDVLFERPNLQPQVIFISEGGSILTPPSNRTGGRVKLISPSGLGMYVNIFFSGQVTVQSSP